MKRNILIGVNILLLLLLVFIIGGCDSKPQKESIVIGASRPLTGPYAIFEQVAFGPVYKMWIDEVNADGGIYVEEYGKKLLIETVIYDDESDIDIMTKNLETLIVEDQVDILLPPAGTTSLFAAAPVANKYGYLLLGAEGGALKLSEMISGLPYVYSVLNYSEHNQIPVLAELMADTGVKTAAIVYMSDVFGIEYFDVSITEFTSKGIEIVMEKSIPLGIEDMSPIIKEAMALNADAFIIFAYPDENILATTQSIELGFNPKMFITGPGANYEFFLDIFGPSVEGMVGLGAWNEKSSPEHKELADKLANLYGRGVLDWWGHNVYYAGLQFLKQAIEKAGTLDNEKIREVFATETFNTVLGPTWFDEGHLIAEECFAGQIGQWQNGIFEVIGPYDKATADFIYPKPEWPEK